MQASVEQLRHISVLQDLSLSQLQALQPHSRLCQYSRHQVIFQEQDLLAPCLYVLISGTLKVSKFSSTGKETLLRMLQPGEIFAAPALVGDCIAPATIAAETESEVLMLERAALIDAIRQTPEIALRVLAVYNQRLQQMHHTIHGLTSERAIVRLVQLIHYYAHQYGTEANGTEERLKVKLPYAQIAGMIGITYEECVRLVGRLKPAISYQRGGTISVHDWQALQHLSDA